MAALALALAAALSAPDLDWPDDHAAVNVAYRPAAQAAWYGVSAGDDGEGDVVLRGEAGYGAAPLSFAVSVDYRVAGAPGWRDQASVSVLAGRALKPRLQVDLRAWKGLNRATGGFGGGLSLRWIPGR